MIKTGRSEAGFTLIELITTATFFATAGAAIIGIFIQVGKLNRQARNLTLATQAAQQKIEFNRNAGYAAIPASDNFTNSLPAQLGSPRSAVASLTDLSPPQVGLKQLDITITYTEQGPATKTVKLTTLVTQQGINR